MQSLKDGTTYLETLPVPHPSAQQVLIKSSRSSALQKAQQQPDKLQQVFQKIKNEGLFSTLETVQNKLDQPIALGYSNVGIVEELGSAVHHLSKGDRVVSNGYHAEYALASKHLCCKIPDNVDDDTAWFMNYNCSYRSTRSSSAPSRIGRKNCGNRSWLNRNINLPNTPGQWLRSDWNGQ